MRTIEDSDYLLFLSNSQFCTLTFVYFSSAVESEKSNCPCRLNSKVVINRIFSYGLDVHDLQKLVSVLPDPTKKGQALNMASQDSKKKNNKGSSKGQMP